MGFNSGDSVWWNKENHSGERLIRTPAVFLKYTDQRCLIRVESKYGTTMVKVVKHEFVTERHENETISTASRLPKTKVFKPEDNLGQHSVSKQARGVGLSADQATGSGG